jgi:hypothetical protein
MEPQTKGRYQTARHRTSTWTCTLANHCRLAKPKIIAGSGVLARGKLLKANYDPGPDIGSFREWTGY